MNESTSSPELGQDLFLVVGARRTGTSLLNSVLCVGPTSNPFVAETQLLTRFVETYVWGRQNFAGTGTYFRDTQQYDEFFAGQVGAFVTHLRRHFAPAERLVIKNPEFSLVASEIATLLPRARFIVSVRDPRDQVASDYETGLRQLEKNIDNPSAANRDIASFAAKYCRYYEQIPLDDQPDRCLVVRYEDLVARTEATVAELARFTGLDLSEFDPDADWQRVGMDLSKFEAMPSFTRLYGKAMTSSQVGRHSDVLTAKEAAIVAEVCGPWMRRFGYD